MSEIACLYKDCQAKINRLGNHRHPRAILVQPKKKNYSPNHLTTSAQTENRNK